MNENSEIPAQTGITEKRAAVEQEFRLAKEYWLRTVQPHIAGRRLRDVELFVAQDAYLLLRGAQRKAEDWNRTQEGRLSPLDVDLSGGKFREPEVLFADENLKPEILAGIAAPLMNKSEARMTPGELVRTAHELLMAAERYIGTLPEKKEGPASWKSDFDLAFGHVLFAEILQSNEKTSGQLPLLPPVQQERNAGKLSLAALRRAVKDFLEQRKKNRPQITEEQYTRETEQNAKLAQEGRITMIVTGKPMTFQEWQSQPDEAIKDCLQNNRILLQDLCTMRWERFKNHWQEQQNRVLAREANKEAKAKTKVPKTKLPKSAASSPTTVGKRQK